MRIKVRARVGIRAKVIATDLESERFFRAATRARLEIDHQRSITSSRGGVPVVSMCPFSSPPPPPPLRDNGVRADFCV